MRPVATRRRSRYLLVVLSLIAVSLIALDAGGFPVFTGARSVADDSAAPFAGVVDTVTAPFRNAWNGVTGYDDLVAENQQLRDRIGELESAAVLEDSAREQLRRLNEQLELGYIEGIPTQVARVSSGAYSNFADYRIEIDRGSSSGLAEGMPVVTRSGLVGRLERVGSNTSVVQLATDPEFVIGVRLASTQDLGVGRGTGERGTFVVDRGIDLGDSIRVGEAVLTSGLSTSIMPPDIPVGLVSSVDPSPTTRDQQLDVALSAELTKLDVVQVLEWEPPR
ncbi:MAG: rod shape-determining protein MreC [Actinomycetota bacterium]